MDQNLTVLFCIYISFNFEKLTTHMSQMPHKTITEPSRCFVDGCGHLLYLSQALCQGFTGYNLCMIIFKDTLQVH